MATLPDPSEVLHFPLSSRLLFDPYTPPPEFAHYAHPSTWPIKPLLPFVTLTYAMSLDSMIALEPGAPTALSGPETKAMTHYLRSKHDAILVGVGTAVADDPSLNCRLNGVGGYGGEGLTGQPIPVVLDPFKRWSFDGDTKIFRLVAQGRGRAPSCVVAAAGEYNATQWKLLDDNRGKVIMADLAKPDDGRKALDAGGSVKMDWNSVMRELWKDGVKSVMVEGGARVINSLLTPEYIHLVNSVIITVAPVWLGDGGVQVSPTQWKDERFRPVPVTRMTDVRWHSFGQDAVMCGRMNTASQLAEAPNAT